MKFDFKKDILPHLIIYIAFLAIVAVYFKPVVFDGKIIGAGDITSFNGTSREAREFKESNPNVEEVFWTNTSFSGMPTYMISTDLDKSNFTLYLTKLLSPLGKVFGWPVNIFVIGLVACYILFLTLRVNKYLAAVGAFAFVFASNNLISVEAGHNAKILSVYYISLILAGFIILFEHRKMLLGAVIISVGSALEIIAGHYQITFYGFFALAIYVIVQFIFFLRKKEISVFFKFLVVVLIAGALGIGANANKLLTVYEYSKETIRGKPDLVTEAEKQAGTKNEEGGLDKDYAFRWSQGIDETLTILIPGYYGNSNQEQVDKKSASYKLIRQEAKLPLYRGDQPFTAGPVYFGALICFLFIFSLFILDNKTRSWLIAITLFSLFISWGRNFEAFNYFIFDNIPGFNKFRTVSMALYLANLTFVVGAILGVNKFLNSDNKTQYLKPLYYSGGLVIGLLLVVYLFTGDNLSGYNDEANLSQMGINDPNFRNQFIDAMNSDRLTLIKKDTLRSLFYVIIGVGVLWALLKDKINKQTAIIIISVITIYDLWSVDKHYLNEDSFTKTKHNQVNESRKTPADDYIHNDKSYYRVFDLTKNCFNDANTPYFHNSIGGYHPAKLKRYQDVITHHLEGYRRNLFDQLGKNPSLGINYAKSNSVINMLNSKYLILGKQPNQVIANENTLGHAWFVEKVNYVNSPNEEIKSLNNDLKKTAYMDQNQFKSNKSDFQLDPNATITFQENKLNTITYSTKNSNDGFAVFSENYYPEWVAYIDGKPVEVKRVNYILRGLEIPAGNHEIKFEIVPETYNSSRLISLGSSTTIYILIGLLIFFWYRQNQN